MQLPANPREFLKALMKIDFSAPENRITRARAIRIKCIDCMGGSRVEVRRCAIATCALWRYRMGYELTED
jgi:hypothetical protein